MTIGSCDCCDRTNVPISRGEVTGIETYACFICQGDTDPDPYGEMEAVGDREGVATRSAGA